MQPIASPTACPFHNHARSQPKVGAEGVGDPYFPKMGNGGYDSDHYDLTLDYDPKSQQLQASSTMNASATQDLDSFHMDFTGFDIGQIQVNGAPAKFERQDGELVITPETPVHQGDKFSVQVDYSGVPVPYASEHAPIALGWNAINDGTYVLSEPDGASTWFPVNDHPRDKATYSFNVTVPNGYKAVANGILQSEEQGAEKTTFKWDAKDPMASYLATVDVGKFVEEKVEGPKGLPIHNFFPSSIAKDCKKDFSRVPEMIEWFSQRFGDYPFEAYGNIVLDASVGGAALETQTRPIFEKSMVTGDQRLEYIYAHELAHQWFGDSVSPQNWKDIWLNEGFACYAHETWRYEHDGSFKKLDLAMRNMHYWLPKTDAPVADPGANDMFSETVYNRGAVTLHVLRKTIGDEKFFQTLHTYTERFAGKNATTDDFVAVANEVSGRDLTDFFQKWVKDEALPPWPKTAGEAPFVPEAPNFGPKPHFQAI